MHLKDGSNALLTDPLCVQVYHCAVMPCYDKKLEAAREDFYLPGTTIPEVDCGLTSIELQQLLDEHGVDLKVSTEPMWGGGGGRG